MFSEKEIAYLRTQRLARIATVSKDLQPDVVPVGFNFEGVYFYGGGKDLSRTLKYKNVQVNPKVSLVIDDLKTEPPTSSLVPGMHVLARTSALRLRGSGVGASNSGRS